MRHLISVLVVTLSMVALLAAIVAVLDPRATRTDKRRVFARTERALAAWWRRFGYTTVADSCAARANLHEHHTTTATSYDLAA